MNWYYIDGPNRVGPLNETEWAELLGSGKILPNTLVWHEGMEKWTPYSHVQEMSKPPADSEQTESMETPVEAIPDDPEMFAARVANLDYQVRLGSCISRAWQTMKSHVSVLLTATLLLLVFSFFVAYILNVISLLEMVILVAFQGVLMGGYYYLFLCRMRGQHATVGMIATGFRREFLTPLVCQSLVLFFVTQLCFFPLGIAVYMLGFNPSKMDSVAFSAMLQNDPEKLLVLMLVFLACTIPAVYFSFCWTFATPLIMDKKMRFWPAMQLSRHKVLQHPWRISVLLVVGGLIGIAGGCLCLVIGSLITNSPMVHGILFLIGSMLTLPFYFLTMLYLYEDMFHPASPSPKTETK